MNSNSNSDIMNSNLPSVMRISEYTFRRIPIVEDGNCFFRAIALWVYGDQEQHEEIRRRVVTHIMVNWYKYKHFIIGDESYDSRIKSANDYGKWMIENGRYGGSQECVAVSEIFTVRLIVYNLHNLSSPQMYGQTMGPIFTLLFSGDQDHGHFDVLVRHDHVSLNIY